MILKDVMAEAARVLTGITKINVFDYPVQKLVPPAGYVSYPLAIRYDESYGRGEDRYEDLPLVLVSSIITTPHARDNASAWSSGAGLDSVKGRMEAHRWETCDDLTVTSAEFDIERIAGVAYLACVFKATVVGPGEER